MPWLSFKLRLMRSIESFPGQAIININVMSCVLFYEDEHNRTQSHTGLQNDGLGIWTLGSGWTALVERSEEWRQQKRKDILVIVFNLVQDSAFSSTGFCLDILQKGMNNFWNFHFAQNSSIQVWLTFFFLNLLIYLIKFFFVPNINAHFLFSN